MSGNNNDVIVAWLKSEGYSGSFNDMFTSYLKSSQGLSGSLADMYAAWRGGAGASAPERYFTTFNSLFNMYGEFSSPVTLAGDFKVRINAQISRNDFMLGGDNNDSWFGVTTNGNVILRIGGAISNSTSIFTEDGVLREFIIERVGTSVTVHVDGVLEITRNSSSPFGIEVIGAGFGPAQFYNGIIANLQIEDNGTLVVDSPIDKPYSPTSNVIENNAAVLGANLTDGVLTSLTGWAEPRTSSTLSLVSGGLRTTADSASTFGASYELSGLTVGRSYRFEGTAASNNSSALVRLRSASNSVMNQDVTEQQGLGGSTSDFLFTATATTMYVGTIVTGHSGGDYVDITRLSIREIPASTPYITLENSAADGSSSASYTLNTDENRWEGVELFNGTPVEIGSYWTDNGDGSFTIDSPDGSANRLAPVTTTVGGSYEIKFNSNEPSGSDVLRMRSTSTTDIVVNSSGAYSQDFISSRTDYPIFLRNGGSGAFTQTVSDISIKQILELPPPPKYGYIEEGQKSITVEYKEWRKP